MRNHLPTFRASLRAPRTAKTYAFIVGQFLDFMDREGITAATRAHVEAFLHRPRRSGYRAGPSTTNQELSALRVFSRHLETNRLPPLPVAKIPFEREPERDPTVMTAGEVRRLFEVVAEDDDVVRRARDLALVAVLTQIGLRVHELVALDIEQVDASTATLLAVRGKGGTRSDLPLNAPTLTLLGAWIASRARVAPPGERALFVSRRGTRLSIRAVERRFVELRDALGTAKKITPHTARHSVATIGLSQGTDVVVISKLLRHARLATTMRYIHLCGTEKRDAVARLGALVPPSLVASVGLPATDVPAATGAANDQDSLDDHEGLADIASAA